MPWACTYQGKPDSISKNGIVAPSWCNFDWREWRKGDLTIMLFNSRNVNPRLDRRHWYTVIVFRKTETIYAARDSSWLRLVRDTKEKFDVSSRQEHRRATEAAGRQRRAT